MKGGGNVTDLVTYTYQHPLPCEGLSAATKLNTARLMNEDIMYTAECNMMEEITEQMLN